MYFLMKDDSIYTDHGTLLEALSSLADVLQVARERKCKITETSDYFLVDWPKKTVAYRVESLLESRQNA